ncbi:MAG TPA: LPS assembly protein LptD [Candidatus Dormibacteraeota bacterium]|nr:LPS assembly protein LptD [Candidatus Dormibacteraeota bacterium]
MSQRRARGAVRWIRCGALLAALAGAGAPLRAEEPPASEGITIDAQSLDYDQKGDILSATGDVLIRRGETTLRADSVEFNRRTSEARAIGDAVLTSPEAEITADAIFLDINNETGELQGARINADRLGYSLSGTRIEKGLGQRYRIEHGRFTTCNCDEGKPDWSIAGDTLDVSLEGYGTLEGGTFNILDVPVLWLPRAAFPVFRERQSGLLFPRVGISNRRGFQLLQPGYWTIDKNQDLTVSGDVETSLRIGVISEYRYAFSEATQGQFQVGYFNEFFRGRTTDVRVPPGANTDTPENRWAVIGHHQQGIPQVDGLSGYLDVLAVGDDLFLREMNTFALDEPDAVNLRTRPFTTTQGGVLEEWNRAQLQAGAIYYQDLVGPTVESTTPNCVPSPGNDCITQSGNESLVIQRLPEVRLIAQKEIGLGLMGDFTGSFTNFQRPLGLAGVRADFKPQVELRLPLGPSVFGSVRAAFRETAYGLTENTMAGGFTGQNLVDGPFIDLPSGNSREIFELHGSLGTQFERVFDFPYFGLDKLKHTVEPELDYLYVPDVTQSDLPVWDGIDRINERSLITYGFATRLLGRSAASEDGERGEVFELGRLSIAQSYDPSRDIPPTSNLSVTGQPLNPGQGNHLSDIDLAVRVNPGPITSVRAYTTYDTSQNNFSSATLGIRLTEPFRALDPSGRRRLFTRASFAVEYRFITDSILQLLDSSIALPVTDRIALLYNMRYNIDAGTFLENYAGLRLLSSCNCWALNIGVTDTRNPNEFQLQAQFTLAGLGAPPTGGFQAY